MTGFDPDEYTEEARRNWGRVAAAYARLAAAHFQPITQAFLELAALRPGERVLDVACGPGTLAIEAARIVGAADRVVGVDLSADMVWLARDRARQAGVRATFEAGDAERLDLGEDAFDAVLCQLGLMLFPRPDEALRRMARAARRGGRVACLVQGSPEGMVFTSLLMKILARYAPQLKQPGAPTLYAFAPPGALEQALSGVGLAPEPARRLSGAFSFPSAQAYWDTMIESAGRTGAVVRSLADEARQAVRDETLAEAARYQRSGGLEIPFEVVMARGLKA